MWMVIYYNINVSGLFTVHIKKSPVFNISEIDT